jgi:hypothetical protein
LEFGAALLPPGRVRDDIDESERIYFGRSAKKISEVSLVARIGRSVPGGCRDPRERPCDARTTYSAWE